MNTVYKYELTPGRTVLSMPEGAQLLIAQMQHGVPCLWALVDPLAPPKTREFWAVAA